MMYLAGRMQLSVIIVNYNVRHFLEQCLFSLREALRGVEAEIIVADNHSSDGSKNYLSPIFPEVIFLWNHENLGFAKANNQAAAMAHGKYILFLNPDTLVTAAAIQQSIGFMDTNPKAGALGISMIDGSGRFLPESKRAFPSPLTSLFKLSGLSALFPSSRIFARYHLGHLPNNKNHEADVLAGAYMMVRREVLKQVGCFDEMFFMYGEDIDLSYRIQKAGWKNYYLAGNSIIHFKGESTRKGSLNYVRMFYQAMIQFVEKHYSGGKAGIFTFFITLAIWLRAAISACGSFIKWLGLPLFDTLFTLLAILLVSSFWQQFVKPGIHYAPQVLWAIIPLYTAIFLMAGGIAGIYHHWYRPRKVFAAMISAIVVNLAVYSLFNESYRFSRGVIVCSGLLAALFILSFRIILKKTGLITATTEEEERGQTLVCGSASAFAEITLLMAKAGKNERLLRNLNAGETSKDAQKKLPAMLQNLAVKELVFGLDEHFTMADAIAIMEQHHQLRYRFHFLHSNSIIGSESKETSGETISDTENFSIGKQEKQHSKRVTDIIASIALLLLFPVNIFLVKKPLQLLANIALVIAAKKTWVGYCSNQTERLPALPAAVLGNNSRHIQDKNGLQKTLAILDYWYAKDYEWILDIQAIMKGYPYLGSN